MYSETDIINWKTHRNDSDKKTCFVTCKSDFPMICDILKDCNDIAYISIESSDNCAKYLKFSHDNSHYLPDADNVCNVEFDDVEHDIVVMQDIAAYVITRPQAYKICEFIDNNIDKHIIIHCRAGQSRSQAVYSYITTVYPDIYEFNEINKINPCLTPNIEVKSKLMKYQYSKIYSEND